MISANQFYLAFKQAVEFRGRTNLSEFSKRDWTKNMFCQDGIVGETVRHMNLPNLCLKREFYRYDAAILDESSELPYNKIKYRQPTSVLALIEHENGPNPEGEYWKLLHFYTKLKVLIFYSDTPERHLKGFNELYEVVSDIHRRNSSEEYLFICGQHRSFSTQWRAWRKQSGRAWCEL